MNSPVPFDVFFGDRPAPPPLCPLIVDSFAGGGGASTGIEMALGRSPDIAINHNAAALALHAANHPDTLHLSENVYKVDPLEYLAGRHVGLAWFSPDCKHFSKAKGGKPVERNIRDLCWIIPGWVERIQKSGGRVDVVIMENVEEFKDYGPLIHTPRGLMPDPDRRGLEFRRWCKKLRSLGGRLEFRELRACDYGAPTIRKRLFVIIRFDGQKIVWPKPTHGAPDSPDVLAGRKLPWRTAAECIDWSLPCPSIFDSCEAILAQHGLRAVRPLADATMARVARGMKRYVLDAKRPFLVSVAHGYSGGRREYPVGDPLGSVTAGGISHGVVVPSLVGCGGRAGQSRPRGGDEPVATMTAKADGCLAVATLVQMGYGEREGQAPRCLDAGKPLGTAVAGGIKHAAAVAYIARQNGVVVGRDAAAPLSTVTAGGKIGAPQQAVVSAFVSRQFGTSTGHPADVPLATTTADGGGKSLLVAPYLQAYYGTGDGGEEDRPCRTITTKDRHGHVEASLDVPPFTEEQAGRAREVAAFMRAHGFWDEREFVTLDVDGETFVIVDVGMRMLVPRELYTAQGFPPDYQIDGHYGFDALTGGRVWVPFSKSVQVSCVGNSVSPPVAAALVGANCPHLAVVREAA
jgi:DNA (cytosine-5)-methyltransferase 1